MIIFHLVVFYHDNYSNDCKKCKKVLIEQQIKLVLRLNKIKDKKDPNTDEKLFTLANEPNFPPYYPKVPETEVNDICPICHDSFDDPHKMIVTSCEHKFCASCFNDYIQTRESMNSDDECICAYCKQIFSLETMDEISEESQYDFY